MTDKNNSSGKEKNLVAILKDPFYQNSLGSFHLASEKNPYGQMGLQTGRGNLSALMGGEEANKIAQEAKNADRENGMLYTAPNEYYAERQVKGMFKEAIYGLSLGKLTETLGSEIKGLEVDVKKDVRNLSAYDVLSGEKKVNEENKEYISKLVGTLEAGYTEYMARKQISPDALVKSLNAGLDSLNKDYSKKEA